MSTINKSSKWSLNPSVDVSGCLGHCNGQQIALAFRSATDKGVREGTHMKQGTF